MKTSQHRQTSSDGCRSVKFGLFGALLSLLASANLAWGQAPLSSTPVVILPSGSSAGFSAPLTVWDDGAGATAVGPKVWVTTEYMLFWIKNGPLAAPLVTTTSQPFLDPHAGGASVLGSTVLFGNSGLDYGTNTGGRLSAGAWLNADETIGISGRGFLLEQASVKAAFASDAGGNPPLNIPLVFLPTLGTIGSPPLGFPGVDLHGPNSYFVTIPEFVSGNVSVASRSQLWGAECNGMFNLVRNNWAVVNGLAGFRYANLREDLSVLTNSQPLPAAGLLALEGVGTATAISTVDTFSTRTQFYGGQVGLETAFTLGRFTASLDGRIGLGDNHQVSNVNGLTTAYTAAGGFASASGGVLALPTNSVLQTRNGFSVMPEGEFRLSYAITSAIKGSVGYDVLYWTNVVRPGDQVNPYVDARTIPSAGALTIPGVTPEGPAPVFKTSDFWVQGITFSLEFSF